MRNGKKVIVIKIGSSTLVNEQGKLDRAYFDGLAAQVHALRLMGWSPLIVSSAAIACGLEALGIEERPDRHAFAPGGGFGGAECTYGNVCRSILALRCAYLMRAYHSTLYGAAQCLSACA